MGDKLSGASGPRKRCLEHAGNQLEDRTLCNAVSDDFAVVQVYARWQVELVAIHIELGGIACTLLVWCGRTEVALQNVRHVRIADA
ncbi:hypothetical protein GmRootA79_37610 [Acidovorax sp. A79]|uniref:hypothetical protein n=1 Tax=Acidovorax sp. A79 TaxID=3056107 RepID=UPI0034E8F7C5